MGMLSREEKEGAVKLLRLLSLTDLLSLVQTITNKQISVSTATEAVQAIIAYTTSPAQLLKRRKLKRDILFQYLATEGIAIDPGSEKHVLAQKILTRWGSNPVQQWELMEVDEGGDAQQAVDFPAPTDSQINTCVPSVPVTVNTQAAAAPPKPPQQSTAEDMELAKAFVTWFYPMVNAYHPFAREAPCENFGPQHFFADCHLKIIMASGDSRMEELAGAQEVSHRILDFVKSDMLKFNPNVDPSGLKGMSNPYGLRIIQVCGTLHKEGKVIGVYEQQFGLARDPDMDNNFRIKYSNMKLVAGQTLAGPPSLQMMEQLAVMPGGGPS